MMAMTTLACNLASLAALLMGIGQDDPASAPARESWDAIFIGNSKVGHINTKVTKLKSGTRDLLRVEVTTVLEYKRQNDRVRMRLRYGTIETPEGSILRLDNRLVMGPSELKTSGDVVNGKMPLVVETNGRKQTTVLDWPAEVRGPYGPELSMARQPLKPGEVRAVKTFIPLLNKIGVTNLAARQDEEIELGRGTKLKLLKVDTWVTMPDGSMPSELKTTYWVDKSGQILKSFTDVYGGQATYRTTREGALASTGLAELDLIRQTTIKVARKLPNPEAAREVVYQLSIRDDDLGSILPNDGRQTFTPVAGSNNRRGSLLVKTNASAVAAAAPDADYLKSNALIQSDDPVVIELARKAVSGAADARSKAVNITRWVAKNLTEKNFSSAFAPASEVAKTLSGDCTEHSVLVAAMCRSQGIPARVAVGLVYATTIDGFGFHMWNEVLLNGRWVALDAALDQIDVDATHIKLTDSSLAGVSPFETFLSVARVSDKLSIQIQELR